MPLSETDLLWLSEKLSRVDILREIVNDNPPLAERLSRAVAERSGARALGIDVTPLDPAGLLDRVRLFFKLS